MFAKAGDLKTDLVPKMKESFWRDHTTAAGVAVTLISSQHCGVGLPILSGFVRTRLRGQELAVIHLHCGLEKYRNDPSFTNISPLFFFF